MPKDVDWENVTFLILLLTSHLAHVQHEVLDQDAVARTCHHCVDLVCFVSQPVNSSLKHRQEHLSVSYDQRTCCVANILHNTVFKAHGSCVRDTAQSILGLGNGTHVLYRRPNKSSALSNPHDTLHSNVPSSGRFAFLQYYTGWTKKHTKFHPSFIVLARPPIPEPLACCPMPPRSGSMKFVAMFSKGQLLLKVLLHTETLFCSLVHNFNTALSKM